MRIPLPTSHRGRMHRLSFWDLACAFISPVLALYLGNAQILANGQWVSVAIYCLLSTAIAVITFLAFRVQDGMARYFSVFDALAVARTVFFSVVLTCVVLFTMTRLEGVPRSTPLIQGLILAIALVAGRVVVRQLHGRTDEPLNYHDRQEHIILIGANGFASAFIDLLNSYAPGQQRVVALLDERLAMVGRAISGVRILGAPQQLRAIVEDFAVHGVAVQRVVVAGEANLLRRDSMREVQRICQDRQIELNFLPRMLGVSEWMRPTPTSAAPTLEQTSIVRLSAYFWVKRIIDVVGSIGLIIALLPLFLTGALICLIDVGVPIFFWQQRTGRDGRSFLVYKFRTLGAPFGSDGKPLPEARRLSAVGQFLRSTRIDELPQLLNVLIGDMSLIGPRPLLPEDQPADARVRLLIRPGITGWAQVHGGKLVTKEQKEDLDGWYVRNASLWVDFQIVLRTFAMVFGSSQAEESLADVEQVQNRNVVTLHLTPAREIADRSTARGA